jgi:hypothetical protein
MNPECSDSDHVAPIFALGESQTKKRTTRKTRATAKKEDDDDGYSE